MTVRAAVTAKLGEPLEVVSVPDPVPAADELVLAVRHCGICGSDLHLHTSYELPGTVMGHEFAGEVVDIGSEVSGWTTGTAAVGLSLASCGHCDACRSGRVRKCRNAAMIGFERPGAYAEYVALPAHDALELPRGFPTASGALVEPLAVARHAIERAGDVAGRDALILGAGPVGLAVALWLPLLGAASVTVSDPAPARRELALGLGADRVVDAGAELGAALLDTAGALPPVVFECVGLPGLIEAATESCAEDGTVVIVGVCFGTDTITPLTAMSKELDLRYAFFYRRQDFEATIAALDAGTLAGDRLVTKQVGLSDLPSTFESLKTPGSEMKVLVAP